MRSKDTLSIKTTSGNLSTKENIADITIEVCLKAEYSDIVDFLQIEVGGKKTRISHLNTLIKKRIK